MIYIDKIMGCLYGGAVGDALGYPVEFLGTEEIMNMYDWDGIRDYVCPEGKALMSANTQMTLFTLGGLPAWRSDLEGRKNKDSWKEYVWKSYQDWLFTQDNNVCPNPPRVSWLADEPVMHAKRAPRLTCLSSLKGEICGSIERPVNDSKGCSGLLQAVSAVFWKEWDWSCTVQIAGAELAAMTHGHRLSSICAASFVTMLSQLLQGANLETAVERGMCISFMQLRRGTDREKNTIVGSGVGEVLLMNHLTMRWGGRQNWTFLNGLA